jgi:hypothetical protein
MATIPAIPFIQTTPSYSVLNKLLVVVAFTAVFPIPVNIPNEKP